MKITKSTCVILSLLTSQLAFAKVSDFLPKDVQVDGSGNLLNTEQLSRSGYSFDKSNKTATRGINTYKFSKDENGNLVLSHINTYSESNAQNIIAGEVRNSAQSYTHIVFNNLEQVKALISCGSYAENQIQRFPGGFVLDGKVTGSTQQAVCDVVTSDSCKIQSDLVKKYFGGDGSVAFKKIRECKDTLKQLANINRQTSNAISLSDRSIDSLNSDVLNTLSAGSPAGKLLGSKFLNKSHFDSANKANLRDIIESVDSFTGSFDLCSRFKDQLAPSAAQADLSFAAEDFQRPVPDKFGKCKAPYISEKGKCEPPTCMPSQYLEETANSVHCVNKVTLSVPLGKQMKSSDSAK